MKFILHFSKIQSLLINFKLIKKNIPMNGLPIVMGTIFQWFDFALFSATSEKIAQTFYPSSLPHAYLLTMVWILFGIGWIFSPLGGMIFGYIGDCFSRKTSIQISIMLMAISSIVIAFLPSYKKIGLLAPMFLVLARMLQGLSSSAEYNGATIYLAENVQTKYKPLFSCLPNISNSAGMILGFFVGTIFTSSIMPFWGWRIPFGLSFVGLLCSYRLRQPHRFNHNDKSYERKISKINIVNLFKKSTLPIVLAAYNGVTAWGLYVWGSSLLQNYGMSSSQASSIIFIALIADIILEPIAGLFAVKFGNKKIFLWCTALLTVFLYPIICLVQKKNYCMDVICLLLITLMLSPATAMINSFVVTAYDKNIRYIGIGIFWNISMAVFGGITPVLLSLITHHTPSMQLEYISFYFMFFLFIGLLTICFHENRQIFEKYRKVFSN